MKIIFCLTFFCLLTALAYSQSRQIKGRIIDEKFDPVLGAQVNDFKNHQHSTTDANGFYDISAAIGDTIEYKFVGSTNETRIVINPKQPINVILMNKAVNDLGGIWTKKQWEQAEKKMNKYYHQLEIKASQLGKWNY